MSAIKDAGGADQLREAKHQASSGSRIAYDEFWSATTEAFTEHAFIHWRDIVLQSCSQGLPSRFPSIVDRRHC